jgi:hypothetical protein
MAEPIEYNVGVYWGYAGSCKGLEYEIFPERVYPGRLEQGKEVAF